MSTFSYFFIYRSKCLGDPALLHKLISDGKVDIDRLDQYDAKFINDTAMACGIVTSGKSKVCILSY
jgi:hypothetical protein